MQDKLINHIVKLYTPITKDSAKANSNVADLLLKDEIINWLIENKSNYSDELSTNMITRLSHALFNRFCAYWNLSHLIDDLFSNTIAHFTKYPHQIASKVNIFSQLIPSFSDIFPISYIGLSVTDIPVGEQLTSGYVIHCIKCKTSIELRFHLGKMGNEGIFHFRNFNKVRFIEDISPTFQLQYIQLIKDYITQLMSKL